MDREEIVKICKRVNHGDKLKDICRELGVPVFHIESLIKSYKIKKSSILDIYYNEDCRKEIEELENKQKLYLNMDTIENLWLKRYKGIDIDVYEQVLNEDEEWADTPRENLTIDLNLDLVAELEHMSEKEGTDISLLIEKMLLQMLERNRETRMSTKGKITYIKTMVYGSECEDHAEEVLKNLKSDDFMKIDKISYKNKLRDIKMYMANYLINNGYSLEQIEEISDKENGDLYDDDYATEELTAHYYFIQEKICSNFEEVNQVLNKE